MGIQIRIYYFTFHSKEEFYWLSRNGISVGYLFKLLSVFDRRPRAKIPFFSRFASQSFGLVLPGELSRGKLTNVRIYIIKEEILYIFIVLVAKVTIGPYRVDFFENSKLGFGLREANSLIYSTLTLQEKLDYFRKKWFLKLNMLTPGFPIRKLVRFALWDRLQT